MGRTMDDRQHLYSEAIYRINSELQSISELDDLKIQLVPCSFDRRLQCFRWLSVHEDNWKWNDNLLKGSKRALTQLLGTDKEGTLCDNWKEFGQPRPIAALAEGWFEPLDEKSPNNWDFGPLLHRWIEIRDGSDWERFDPDMQCHRALIDLVAGRAIHTDKYVEGLVFKLIKQAACSKKRVSFVTSKLLERYTKAEQLSQDSNSQDSYPEYPPAEFKCYYHGDLPDPPRYYSQETGEIRGDEGSLHAHLKECMDLKNISRKDKHEEFGLWAKLLQNAMMCLDGQEKLHWFVSIPIYDGGTLTEPWGRVVGIVHAMIYRATNDKECSNIAELIIKHFDRLRVVFRATARAQVAAAPIAREDQSGPDLAVQQFLRLLPRFQDWERVSVCRETDSQNIQCWTRYQHHKAGGLITDWGKCDARCSSCPTRLALGDAPALRDDVMTLSEDLSVLIQMPWVGKRELAEIADLRFAFQLPSYAVVPPREDEEWERLRRQYLHEQIDVLRLLVPKVQAHRRAVRTAAAAIMGRNMSHNIGSHVLARYSTKIGKDLDKTPDGKTDHRGDFLAYLQRRMDFLAEVATSDQAFWSESLSLREQIGRLNYNEQKKRFGPNNPIILSYITGKSRIDGESLIASVEWGSPRVHCNSSPRVADQGPQHDYWIACPGGEVGIHALFVILENIIRNSARHGSSAGVADEAVRIFVDVEDEGDPKLLKLEIIDPRAELNEKDEPRAADEHPLLKKINGILEETLLDPDGAPNPHNWGVREMQICAHYLRGLSFFDLEMRQGVSPVLKAGFHPLGGDRHCLKYILYVQRPKLMAAVIEFGPASRS